MSEKPTVETIVSPNDLAIYHCGPDRSQGPLPALFYFALSGPESLSMDPFNLPVVTLHNSSIRCFSFTLPYHQEGDDSTIPMRHWAEQLSLGNNFFEPFLEKAMANISFLIEQNYIDPNKIAVAGLSRGGFVATHLAARDARIKTILGYAPLTQFGLMNEFYEKELPTLPKSLGLNELSEKLTDRTLRFYIGNRDVRVGTRECFEFIQNLTDASFLTGHRSPPIELIISPSIGHRGHGTSPHIFEAGANWIKEQFRSPL
jgi:hypothetical protein